ncbi:MAG: hypothetical protein J7L21_02895 [Sulfurimonas sp.]|nr:hypothetical protein [Sulfurimonas sp.]
MFRLYGLGYPECHKYGISYFIELLDAANELENEKLINLAFSMRVSNSEPKHFDEYISLLRPKVEVSEDEAKSNQDEFIKMFN